MPRTGLPFVHLKLAVSLDGKIATRTGDARWITGPEARARAHELRHEYDAVLVGAGTATTDDPLLTDRSGLPRRRPLVRVVLANKLRLSPDSKLARSEAPLIVIGNPDLRAVLKELADKSLQSVLVEGGATVAGAFLDAGLVNKVTFFIAPKIIGGAAAPSAIGGAGIERMSEALELERISIIQRGKDIEVTGYPRRTNG